LLAETYHTGRRSLAPSDLQRRGCTASGRKPAQLYPGQDVNGLRIARADNNKFILVTPSLTPLVSPSHGLIQTF